MKILITGCAGFIGARTSELLLESGNQVLGVDNFSDYYDCRLKEYRIDRLLGNSEFVFNQIDILDEAMDDLIDTYRPEAIINFAACAGVRYSMQDPFIFFRVNTDGHLHLLDLARKYDIKKVILASTSSLYAGCELPFKESLPVNEPISPYAASKKGAEAISYTYHYLYGLDTIIFRYFTVYGPAGRPDMCMFRFIEWAKSEKPLILYGDGSQSRDFTFVDDIARGTIMGLGISGHKIINLGGDETHSVNEVIDEIKGNLNKPVSVVAKAFHKADMQATSADISIARSYGWSPKVNFKEGIKRTVNWHNQNRSLLDKINLGDT